MTIPRTQFHRQHYSACLQKRVPSGLIEPDMMWIQSNLFKKTMRCIEICHWIPFSPFEGLSPSFQHLFFLFSCPGCPQERQTSGSMLSFVALYAPSLLEVWTLHSNMGITWELVANAESRSLLQNFWIRTCALTTVASTRSNLRCTVLVRP